jgi:hypothetical protein
VLAEVDPLELIALFCAARSSEWGYHVAVGRTRLTALSVLTMGVADSMSVQCGGGESIAIRGDAGPVQVRAMWAMSTCSYAAPK